LYIGKKLIGFPMLTNEQFLLTAVHINSTSMSVETHEFQHDSDLFQDENLRVVPVIAYPTTFVPELSDSDSVSKNQELTTQRKRALSKSGSSSDESDSDLQQLSPRAQQKYRKKVLTKMFVPSSPGNNDHQRKKGAGYVLQEQKQTEDLANAANAKVFQPASDESQAIVQEIDEDVQPPRKKPTVQQQQNANRARYMNRRLPSTKPIPAAISYICRGPEVKGKFNKAAAVALGIKPGPMYGKLHRGESITLDDGTVVTPDRVCDPPVPGHVSYKRGAPATRIRSV
jgi:ribonuclease Z